MIKLSKDYNLEVLYPDIAKEWHPTKNGSLKPNKVYPKSSKKAWWLCRGGHAFFSRISGRTIEGAGCNKCSRQTSKPELYFYAELQSIFNKVHHRKKFDNKEIDIFVEDIKLAIEYDGSFFHKNKIKHDTIKKNEIKKLGFYLINVREEPLSKIFENDLVISPKVDLHEIFMEILHLVIELDELPLDVKENINEYLLTGLPRNNDLYKKLVSYLPGPLPGESLAEKFPEIAKEWHPTKNGALTPENMHPGADEKIWWICSKQKCEYEAFLYTRTGPTQKGSCPFCSGKKVGYGNDLQTQYPQIAKMWHPTKNGNLKPYKVTPGSQKKVWWICQENHIWHSRISHIVSGKGCPFCSKTNRTAGYGNDLKTNFPQIAKEWHPTKNGDLTADNVTPKSSKKVWWLCNKGHSYESVVATRVVSKNPEKSCSECYTKSGFKKELKPKIKNLLIQGKTAREVSEMLGVSLSFVYVMKKSINDHG